MTETNNQRLTSFIEREEEKAGIAGDIKEVYAEAHKEQVLAELYADVYNIFDSPDVASRVIEALLHGEIRHVEIKF